MTQKPVQPQDKYVVRFPEGLRDRIKAYAAESGRSMNAEIVHRLDLSQIYENYPLFSDWVLQRLEDSADTNGQTLTDEIRARVEFTLAFDDATFHPQADIVEPENRTALDTRIDNLERLLTLVASKVGVTAEEFHELAFKDESDARGGEK